MTREELKRANGITASKYALVILLESLNKEMKRLEKTGCILTDGRTGLKLINERADKTERAKAEVVMEMYDRAEENLVSLM